MCKYCEETSCISTVEFDVENSEHIEKVYADVRMDIRPEDDLYQIDCLVAYRDNRELGRKGEWSSNCLNINFCPMCGRNLRAKN